MKITDFEHCLLDSRRFYNHYCKDLYVLSHSGDEQVDRYIYPIAILSKSDVLITETNHRAWIAIHDTFLSAEGVEVISVLEVLLLHSELINRDIPRLQ